MEKIKNNIFVETDFLGCNPSFVVTSCGVVMIDTPQKPCEAFQWRKEIQNFGNVIYIINTDHHRDHAIGNYYFNGDIIVHEGTMRRLLSKDRVDTSKEWIKLMDSQSTSFIDYYFVKKPKFTFSHRMTIRLGEDVFQLIHVTSHTQDETLVYMPEKKALFSGDTVCTLGIPSLYESYPFEWLEALELIETLDFDVLIPGHGRIGDKESSRQFHKDLSRLIYGAKEKIEAGMTKEELVQAIGYDDAVHANYPPAFTNYFKYHMKENIERLYDYLIEK